VHVHLFVTHLRLQISLLTYGSAGEAAVTCQPKRASAATDQTFSTPRKHTLHTATKQHNKLHRMAANPLWYVLQ
jgi:hypothetical protein